MAIWGKNGFVRKSEIAFARKLLGWKVEKSGTAPPDEAILRTYAEKIVEDAHGIAKQTGSNILEILKESVKNFKKQ